MKKLIQIMRLVSGSIWAVMILLLIFAIINPAYLSLENIMNILRNASILLIVSIGMTLVVLSGQINIAVGGIVTLSAVLAAGYIQKFEDPGIINILVAFIIGGGTGLIFGFLEGLLIGRYRFNYWLVTFTGMSMSYGLAKAVSDGGIVAGFAKNFRWVSAGKIMGISMCIIFSIIICILMIQFIGKSRFGMHVYAIGNSEKASINSGINVGRTRIYIYSLCGLLAGIAAVFLIARTNSAGATVGDGYEFSAIAAVVIGGTSMEGGKGSIWGTIFGTIFISALKNGLQVVGLNNYWQQAYLGIIIMIIIVYDVLSAKSRAKKNLRRKYDAY